MRELRTRCPDLKVVVLSVHDEQSVRKAAIAAGADAFVLKREIATAMLADRNIAFAVSRADQSFRSWLGKYGLMELIGEENFCPTNRHAAAAFRGDAQEN